MSYNPDTLKGLNVERADRKFGYNDAVGTSFEDVWTVGGTKTYLTSAVSLRIAAGGSAADITATGAGAREVIIEGLDANWNEVREAVATNGTSASSGTTTNFIRVNRVWVSSVGTYHSNNTGVITIETATGSVTQGGIQAGQGQSETSLYSVPAGLSLFIPQIHLVVEDSNTAQVELLVTRAADTALAVERLSYAVPELKGSDDLSIDSMLYFPEKTDLRWRAKRITGSGTAKVSVSYDLILAN